MASSIGGITSNIIGFALDGLSLRHQAIASNIANADVAGYRPVKVSFEDTIAAVQNESIHSADSALFDMTPSVSYGPPISGDSNRAALETEIVLLNQNVIQYQSLIKGLEKYKAAIAEAIKEGRR